MPKSSTILLRLSFVFVFFAPLIDFLKSIFIFPLSKVFNVMTLTLRDCHFESSYSLYRMLIHPFPTFFFFFALNSLKPLLCHRFIRRCSGRLEIMGKACFLYGPEFGCRMGSGAEASPLIVTSICSTPLVSIGYSTGV